MLLSSLNGLIKNAGVERLVVNGDIVDPIFRKWRLRWRLHDFVKGMECKDVHLVKGNHDAKIEEIVPLGARLHQSGGARLGDIGMCHGHRRPSPQVLAARTVVISHSHPVVALRDEIGIALREPCWLRWKGKGRDLVVLPPFNPFMGGHPVNSGSRRPSIVFEQLHADFERCEVYLLDGTHLGKVVDLMERTV
jgi:putative SbcD/Mre11-related phosphoesterase